MDFDFNESCGQVFSRAFPAVSAKASHSPTGKLPLKPTCMEDAIALLGALYKVTASGVSVFNWRTDVIPIHSTTVTNKDVVLERHQMNAT